MNEALEEISQKINLLNEEQDRIDGQRESRVSMIITVFGLVSIVSAALQMLDYISTGKPLMIIGFLVTGTAIILFFLYLIFNERKKKPVFSIINSSGWSKRAIITTETYQYDIIFCGENITVNRQKYVMDESIDSELEQFYRFLNETEEKYN